ncbi:MAG: 3-deoxy-D-manno-octulosonic acid kinase [Aeromonas sp.]
MQTIRDGQHLCWFAAEGITAPGAHLFDPTWWQQQQQVVGSSFGRGVTWFVRYGEQQLVLRHYYRGGLVGKFIRDSFWFHGARQSRAMAEFILLNQLHAQGLPVPKAVGAHLLRRGPVYRADILIERIRGAKDLVALLKKAPLSDAVWHQIGATLRQLHNAGAYHSDLNSHNLLLDKAGKVWVIDLDKGAIKAPGAWQRANLKRLLRSLYKEQQLHSSFYFSRQHWQILLAGYLAHGT